MSFTEEINLRATDNASGTISGVSGQLRGLLRELAALAGVGGAMASFAGLVKEGLNFQKVIEDSQIGIAGIIGSLHEYRDASGQVVKGEAAWSAALADSADVQRKLQTAALTTTASYMDMVEAFQVGVMPMSRAGIALNDAAEATQRLTQVAGAAGLPLAQLGIEMRQFFNGDEVRSRLLQTLGITKAQIEEHKKLGDMMDFLRQKTETYARASQAAAQTMTGLWSNLKDAIQQTLGIGMEPLYAKLKGAIEAAASQFVSFGKDDKGNLTAQFSPEMIARVQSMAENLAVAVDRFKEMIPAVVDFGLALAEHISKGIDLLSRLPFKEILAVITDLVKITNGWGLALLGVSSAVGGLSGMLGILTAIKVAGLGIVAVMTEMTTALVAATGASAGLAAGFVAVSTAGLFVAAIASIAKIIEGLRIAVELKGELEKADAAEKGAGEGQLRYLGTLADRLSSSGPMTQSQMADIARIREVQNTIQNELAETGHVSEYAEMRYSMLVADLKDDLPAPGVVELTRKVKTAGGEMDETRSKYLAFVADLKDRLDIAGLEGLDRKLAEVDVKLRRETEKIRKEYAGTGTSEAEALLIQEAMLTKFKLAAKDQGRTYMDIVETSLQASLALFKGGEAQVKAFIGAMEQKRKEWTREAEGLLAANPDDGAAGVKAGWLTVLATLPTVAETAASAVRDVWQSMARSFDDLFYNVLSGRLDNLGDVFKNLWQSLLQTFSRFLTDMVQRWIKSQLEMRIAAYGEQQDDFMGPRQPGKSGGAGGAGILGYVGAAGAGYGIGGNIGAGGAGNQWGGAIGAVGGLALGSTAAAAGIVASIGAGAAAGSVAPIIGTIIGAIVGAIIGGLFNKSTEKSITGSIGGMVGATRYDMLPVYGKRDRETRGTEGEYGEPPIIGYETRASLERATTSFEREGQKVFQAQAATLADIFRVGAKGQASELLASYQATLKESLSGAWFKISAGSDEDIEKDAGIILTQLLPRIGLSAAFGQTGYLPHGDRDGKGGIPGVNWGMPGMDDAGNWTGEKKLYSDTAPLVKMLLDLDFTREKISELAGRISTDDPAKLLAYIQGIVGFVAGVRELGAEMGKTFAELKAGWDEEADAGAAVGIGKRASELASLFDELSLYSGDEQLAKAQEVQAASAEFWDSVKSYLKELDVLAEKLSAGLQGMREKMRDFLNPLSETGANAADQATIDGTWGKLFTATTSAQIEAATSEAAAAIERMFNVMAERVTRGTALLDQITGIIGKLGSLRTDGAFARLEQENPLAAWGQEMVKIQGRIADASKLSGLEQIAALEEVGASAEEMYQNLSGLLADIANVSASINKSFDSQIWELGVGELDPSGQASAITSRIQELQEQLKIATSPAEIQSIASEIQSLTSRYVGQFGKDDPNRAEAIAWAQQQLDDSRDIANAALALLREQAEAFGDQLETMLTGATTTITTNVNEASTIIRNLSFTLGELDRIVRESLERLGQDALDTLAPLREAMDGAAKIFTDATGAAALALSGPEEAALDASAKRTASAFGDAEQAIRKFITTVNGFTGPGETPAQGQKVSTSGRATAAQIIATYRRYSGSMKARVA